MQFNNLRPVLADEPSGKPTTRSRRLFWPVVARLAVVGAVFAVLGLLLMLSEFAGRWAA